MQNQATSHVSLAQFSAVAGKIGLLSFGGPAAQIALMQDELADKRGWISQQDFLRALSFCMLLPGRRRCNWQPTLAGGCMGCAVDLSAAPYSFFPAHV